MKKVNCFYRDNNSWYIRLDIYYDLIDAASDDSIIPFDLAKAIVSNDAIFRIFVNSFCDMKSKVYFYSSPLHTRTVVFDKDVIVKSFNHYLNNKSMPVIYRNKCKILSECMSFNYFIKYICPRRVSSNLRYADLFNFISANESDFSSQLQSTTILGLGISELFSLVNKEIFEIGILGDEVSPIYEIFDIPDDLVENIKHNMEVLNSYIMDNGLVQIIDGHTLIDVCNYISNGSPDLSMYSNQMIIDSINDAYPYGVPSKFRNVVYSFIYNKSIDEDAIKPYNPENQFIDEMSLNPEFKEMILSEIPLDYSLIQKAYYIYKRLCMMFSYDEEYQAVNQKRILSIKHNSKEHIREISSDNNLIICSDSNFVFDLFLKELGIGYTVLDSSGKPSKKFYGGHMFSEFKCGDYIVSCDMTSGVYRSDLASQKIYGEVNHFYLINHNARTKDNFKSELKRVNRDINDIYGNLFFKDMIDSFDSKYRNTEKVSFAERVDILLSIFGQTGLQTVDEMSLILDVCRPLFSNSKYGRCFDIYFVGNSVPSKEGIQANLVSIIVLNEKDIDNINSNIYLIAEGPDIIQVSLNELQRRFDEGILNKDFEIPGIITTAHSSIAFTGGFPK